MIKSFNELKEVKVKITSKPTFKYNNKTQEFEAIKGKEIDTLSWVDCLEALYANGAEKVIYENIQNADGGLLFKDENDCLSIKVFVDIDGDRREIFYPVIDGSKDIKLAKITQSDIYNAKQRAFVKCVALNWGLGLSLWQKNDIEETVVKETKAYSCAVAFRQVVNASAKKLGSVDAMLKKLGGAYKEKDIKALIESATKIDEITAILERVLDDKESR